MQGYVPTIGEFRSNILGPLELVTSTSGLVVSLAEAKKHCRVDISDDDSYLTSLILRAQAFVETNIMGHRQLLTATYDLPVMAWWNDSLRLPRPPLQSITSVKYYDIAEQQLTVESTKYLVRRAWRQPGCLSLLPYQYWLYSLSLREYPITIRFVCGYETVASVPETLKQAILLLVAHWYLFREPVVASGAVPQEISMTVKSLLESEGYGFYG